MIKSKKLNRHRAIIHGFFNRLGGVSEGIYKSLNCGIGSKDKRENIKKNISLVKKQIGIKNNNLIFLSQYHSKKVYHLKKIPRKKIMADAIITNKKKITLCIVTADCAPILLFDKKLKIIAAAHAGWRGAFKGILIKLLEKFILLGSDIKNITVAIGPCISFDSYNVGNEFMEKFTKKNQLFKKFFKKKYGLIYFNLSGFLKSQLLKIGIKNIEIINKDTFSYKNNFFSHRYSIKKKLDDYGRNISVIVIK